LSVSIRCVSRRCGRDYGVGCVAAVEGSTSDVIALAETVSIYTARVHDTAPPNHVYLVMGTFLVAVAILF
jgi:hypothetical protein